MDKLKKRVVKLAEQDKEISNLKDTQQHLEK